MFIGHYAIGFAAKRLAPQTSLGILIAAPTLLDLLWPIFLLVGWEEVRIEPGNTKFTPLNFVSYPVSHGLVASIAWATLFATGYYMYSRYRRGAIVVWCGVVSHWVLDLLVHRPDLPLYAGGPKFGLGLWNHPRATVFVEVVMYAAALFAYDYYTRAKYSVGIWAFWSFALVVGLFYVVNVYLPPPASVRTLAFAAIGLGWFLVLWAGWFDLHREPINP